MVDGGGGMDVWKVNGSAWGVDIPMEEMEVDDDDKDGG